MSLPLPPVRLPNFFEVLVESNRGLWDDALDELIYILGRGLVVRTAAGDDASAALIAVLERNREEPFRSDPDGKFLLNPTPEAAENFSDLAWAVGDDTAWSRLIVRVGNKDVPCGELVVYSAHLEIPRSVKRRTTESRRTPNPNLRLSERVHFAERTNFTTFPFSRNQYRQTRNALRRAAPHTTAHVLKGAMRQIVESARNCESDLEYEAMHKELQRGNRAGDLLRQWRPGHLIPRRFLGPIQLGASLASIDCPVYALSVEQVDQARHAALAHSRLQDKGGRPLGWALTRHLDRLLTIYKDVTGKALVYSVVVPRDGVDRAGNPGARFLEAALAPFRKLSPDALRMQLRRLRR